MKKLDVGCGDRKYAEHIGMDIVRLECVDVVHDMNKSPWPFPDDTFDEIVLDDVLEHSSDFLTVLSEIFRTSKNDAIVKISVPHFSSDNMYSDPTHRIFFSTRSFNYFDKSLGYKHSYYLPHVNLKIVKKHISFIEFLQRGLKRKMNPFRAIGIEMIVNKFPRIYEKFFCWILPCAEIYFELIVIKNSLK